MKTTKRLSVSVVIATMLLALGGCAGMSTTDKATAIGAGVGGVAGNLLGGGGALGTIGGAAVGGVIGHEVGRNQERRGY